MFGIGTRASQPDPADRPPSTRSTPTRPTTLSSLGTSVGGLRLTDRSYIDSGSNAMLLTTRKPHELPELQQLGPAPTGLVLPPPCCAARPHHAADGGSGSVDFFAANADSAVRRRQRVARHPGGRQPGCHHLRCGACPLLQALLASPRSGAGARHQPPWNAAQSAIARAAGMNYPTSTGPRLPSSSSSPAARPAAAPERRRN